MSDPIQKSASSVLRRRYIQDDPGRAAAVERERVSAEVAQMIYDRRTSAGLTQKQLADLLGTKQSVISRLEDADYEGHSLGMLQRVADALDQRLHVQMTPKDSAGSRARTAGKSAASGLAKPLTPRSATTSGPARAKNAEKK
jgi:transcriptional regulator with XRE-family HTH domain